MSGQYVAHPQAPRGLKKKIVPKGSCRIFDAGFSNPGFARDIPGANRKFHAEALAEIAAEFAVAVGFLPPQSVVEMRGAEVFGSKPLDARQKESDRIASSRKGDQDSVFRIEALPSEKISDGFGKRWNGLLFRHAT